MIRAPYDPNPTTDTSLFNRKYHWAWRTSKLGKLKIVLHIGAAKNCRKIHYNADGTRVVGKHKTGR